MIILQDTREKKPWNFSMFEDVEDIVVGKLVFGDYTLKGYEDVVAIERKATTGELALNFGQYRKQFMAEMDRMMSVPRRYIICEFPEQNLKKFPTDSNIPKRHWPKLKMSSGFIIHSITTITNKYDINFIFTNGKEWAKEKAMEVFRDVVSSKKMT